MIGTCVQVGIDAQAFKHLPTLDLNMTYVQFLFQ